MATVLRTGWTVDNPSQSSSILRANIPTKFAGGLGTNVLVKSNISNGNYDVYQPSPLGDNLIYSRNASNNQLIVRDKELYNQYFDKNRSLGQQNFDTLDNKVKVATYDLAQINTGTDPVNNRNFENIKKTATYKSLANRQKPGQRLPEAETASPTPVAPASTNPKIEEQYKKTDEELAKSAKARDKYDNVKYPENLQVEQQDCIKFTILQYARRGLSLAGGPTRILPTDPNKLKELGRFPKGTITLPIPGGINDINSVDWQKDDLNLATAGVADVITQFVAKGSSAAGAAAQKNISAAFGGAGGKEALTSIVAVTAAQSALGANVLSRAYGGVLNPNSELLFGGPQLRNFTFTFRLSPRSSPEAVLVKKIIRTFKQAMSVQRSESVLILKAPDTFAIEYITSGGKPHPYLTKFKECALTQCNVNYTPDGTYMTYAGEPSMTAYELQLTFQELEPVFNDDYGTADNDYDNIGY